MLWEQLLCIAFCFPWNSQSSCFPFRLVFYAFIPDSLPNSPARGNLSACSHTADTLSGSLSPSSPSVEACDVLQPGPAALPARSQPLWWDPVSPRTLPPLLSSVSYWFPHFSREHTSAASAEKCLGGKLFETDVWKCLPSHLIDR